MAGYFCHGCGGGLWRARATRLGRLARVACFHRLICSSCGERYWRLAVRRPPALPGRPNCLAKSGRADPPIDRWAPCRFCMSRDVWRSRPTFLRQLSQIVCYHRLVCKTCQQRFWRFAIIPPPDHPVKRVVRPEMFDYEQRPAEVAGPVGS